MAMVYECCMTIFDNGFRNWRLRNGGGENAEERRLAECGMKVEKDMASENS